MAAIVPDLTQSAIFTAVRAWILSIVDCEVIKAQNNRTAVPVADSIYINIVGSMPLSRTVHTDAISSQAIKRATAYTLQIDCYGANASARAQTISTLWADDQAFRTLAASGISPLYASDPQQIPADLGDQQFTERWTIQATLQGNPTVTIAQETAGTVSVNIINVERTYGV